MIIKYNLQFFAKDGPGGEKTEQPTSKKLQDARKEGQVAKSKEIANAFVLLSMFLLIRRRIRSTISPTRRVMARTGTSPLYITTASGICA